MKLYLHTDGGARGNPGPAAIGIVLKNSKKETIKELGIYIGKATNNEAEYQALIRGMEETIAKNAKEIECVVDSELLVKQLNGEYRVKNARMKNYWLQVKKLEEEIENVSYTHVKREKNKEADALVNQVLDSIENA